MSRIKILVVEDDLFYQTYVNDLLADSETDVINATDGETGLRMALEELPDLILTDIEIPKIQGFVLLRKLREDERTASIPVIMMSGKVEQSLLERHAQLRVRANEYLLKPFSSHQLFNAIRTVLPDRSGELGLPDGTDQAEQDGEAAPGPVLQAPRAEEPAPGRQPPPSDAPKAPPEARPERKLALVVDDSRYILDVARDFLGEMGFEVITAMDGEEGLAAAQARRPDIVFLDVQMPRLNGFVVCERLKADEQTRGIPVVLMSAVVDSDSFRRHSRLRHHADDYIQKPFMKREIQDLTARLTSRKQPVPGVQEKTGFLLPQDEDLLPAPPQAAVSAGAEGLKQLRGEMEALRRRNAQLETDMEQMRKQEDAFLAEIEDLSERLRHREKEQDTIDASFVQAKERLEARTRELEARLGEAESAAEEQRSSAEAAEGKVAEFQRMLSDREALREKDLKGAEDRAREALQARDREHEERVKQVRNELHEKIRQLQEAGSGSAERLDRMEKEKKRLIMDLKAAQAAKEEIEEQAKAIVKGRESNQDAAALREENKRLKAENETMGRRLAEAEASAKWSGDLQERLEELTSLNEELSADLVKARSQLKESGEAGREEMESLRGSNRVLTERITALEELRETLRKELDDNRGRFEKLQAAAGEAARDSSESMARQERLEEELREAGQRADAQDEQRRKAEGRAAELEKELESEKAQRQKAESAVSGLKRKLEEAAREVSELSSLRSETSHSQTAAEALRSELKEARSALDEARTEGDGLRKRAEAQDRRLRDLEEARRDLEERLARAAVEVPTAGQGGAEAMGERLGQLEETLRKTVMEAQAALARQQEREGVLEQNLRNLAVSLDEERAEFRREREILISRQEQMRTALEEMARERRQFLGEDLSRYVPVQMAREARPVAVALPRRWYGIAAAALLLVCAFFLGYLTLGRVGSRGDEPTAQPPAATAAQRAETPPSDEKQPYESSLPTAALESAREAYERLWRKQTVQSVSEDMRLWATLHTRDELSSAARLASSKEGWTSERNERAMAELQEIYRLGEAYYVTVHIKNLRGGYPGYADGLEKHLFLRDGTGREIPAAIPERLRDNRFITSRVAAAGKEADRDLMYEVGITVAFPKGESKRPPKGLQLVVYDVGSIPMRVLTWDVQEWASGT